MQDRIRWKQGRYSNFGGHNWLGYVGTHKLWAFQVWTGVGHEDGWQLIAQLPGLDERPESADPDELKARAEDLLTEFVHSLGAIFPDANPAATEGDRCHAMSEPSSANPESYFICTAPPDHEGDHAACSGGDVLRTWPRRQGEKRWVPGMRGGQSAPAGEGQ